MNIYVGPVGSAPGDGEWTQMGTVARDWKWQPDPDPSDEAMITTLREFSGSLSFTIKEMDHRRFYRLLEEAWRYEKARKSKMHSAYRAKTRRRNRRCK